MSTNDQAPGNRLLVKTVVDFLLAAGTVVAIAWGLLKTAQALEERPLRPGPDGVLVLPAWKARLHGAVDTYPRDKEQQPPPFGYSFGRELYAERHSRKIGHWTSTDAVAEWPFRIETPGTYQVEVEYACAPDAAGSEYVLSVADQQLAGRVSSTGGAQTWTTAPLGKVAFPGAGTYTLRVQARQLAHESLMNLKQVVLRNEQP
jgi:hypothetical protein